MTKRPSNRFLLAAWIACALAACSGGGATIGGPGSAGAGSGSGGAGGTSPTPRASGATAAPSAAPTATSTATGGAASTATPTADPNYTIPPGLDSDAPPLATVSSQMWGLGCSPRYVVSSGGIGSCNMKWISHFNMPPTSIGGVYVPSLHTFFVSGYEHGLYAFDVSDPNNVSQTGMLNIDLGSLTTPVIFSIVENEDLETNGKFIMLSSREYQTTEVVDITNPAAMRVESSIFLGEGHTLNCITYAGNSCAYAYTAYQPPSTAGHIIDMRDPTAPILSGNWTTVDDNDVHDLTEVRPGLLATAQEPVSFIDTTTPANPKFLFSLPTTAPEPEPIMVGGAHGGHSGHSVQWPRQGQDRFFFGQDEGIYNGRCEDYPDDGRTLYGYDTTGWQSSHKFNVVGSFTLQMGDGDLGPVVGGAEEIDSNGQPSTVAYGFLACSAHWDFPQENFNNGGLVALAAFSFGARILNVASTGQLQQVAWFIPNGLAGGSTAEVHWIGGRYLALIDFDSGGLDIVEYTGPLPASGPIDGLTVTPDAHAVGTRPQARAAHR